MTSLKWMQGKDTVEMLQLMMALDLGAVEAYRISIERVQNKAFKEKLKTFMQDHARHVRDMEPIVRKLGGTPPNHPDLNALLPQGPALLVDMTGDEALLKAIKANENDTNMAYELALEKAPAEAKEVLQRGREDERRHQKWVVETLASLSRSASAGGKPDINEISPQQLQQQIEGIGEVTANQLIALRKRKGKIESPDQLKELDGIDEAMIHKIAQGVNFPNQGQAPR